MEQYLGTSPQSWKDAENADQMRILIDCGVLLNWHDMRRLNRTLSPEDEIRVIRHFAVRLAERVENRLSEEILIESLLVWLSNSSDEKYIRAFIEELFDAPNHREACLTLVELAITTEISNSEHDEDLFSMAVALICEIGLAFHEILINDPESDLTPAPILAQMATYLLSVSNTSNNRVRLSLLHYFGVTESIVSHKAAFNRIMSRFGHTVLEHLFTLLFAKKTEAVALQYLLKNIPYILDADNHCQRILHETWKYYMLKKPERFALFIQTLAEHICHLDEELKNSYKTVFLQHLCMLLKVANEVNHRDLGRIMMTAILRFETTIDRQNLIAIILQDQTLRPSFHEQFESLIQSQDSGQKEGTVSFRPSKRGRKPSFSRNNTLDTLHQISFLGSQVVARAS